MSLASWFAAGRDGGPLEVLKQDGDFVLYKSWSTGHDGHRQCVLTVLPLTEAPPPSALNRLTHEYELRDHLDDSWAVLPLELVHERGRTLLRLACPAGLPLEQLIGGAMEVGLFLRLAVALSRAVGGLHARGLVHKDIKPANLFVEVTSGQAWLTGFGIASRLPRQRQSPEPPEVLAGTLAYMAPEQTGRMNRSIDSRSDLYSLGVTLYQVLTGSLPFTALDPMEWVHCHIAKKPLSPAERVDNLPAPVSAIIMKLLAKTAEERYQTATGLESDLRRCLAQWENRGRIDEFPLGERDTPDRLLMPEKLYGRAAEIQILLTSFDRVVTNGTPQLVLVAGYSGIGKSSVVNELHKVLVPPRGLFASGKFEQYKRDIPYATLAQAFQKLVRPLLSKPEPELRIWRDALREALDPNGFLIVDLVPELKHIIGGQPPVPVLPPQDAQRRFQLVFRRFIGVFARPEHPLALFLDDLQWLDAATLDLLEDLLNQSDVRQLMLIGAYRDNEVDSTHPLMRKLAVIRKTGVAVQEIVLGSLTRADLDQLIADSLRCKPERAAPLASLVHEKTGGNPFFAIQFLSSLADEELLEFDHREAHWRWDLAQIHAKGYTANVVDLMLGKLSRLAVETQQALRLLACIGNQAEFALLQRVFQDSSEAMHRQLWEAVQTGLIFRSEGSYRFLHDRVQEAAYSSIPEGLRAATHLRIGRWLAAEIPPEEQEEKIFEIVNQLNRGRELITSPQERERLAEFNLTAGERAKMSAAYASALSYFVTGAELLGEDRWKWRHEIAFRLQCGRAECEFLLGRLTAAEELLTVLASHAGNTVELATVACLRIDVYTSLDQSARGVAVCLDYLRHLNIEWSSHPDDQEVRREYEQIWSHLGSRTIEQLIDLPLMSESASLATLDVLNKVLPPALFTDVNLLALVICRAVNLSIEGGNSDSSCVAYAWLGQIAGPHFGNYKAGYRFGQLGYDLVEKLGLKRFQARTSMVFGSHVVPWMKHVRTGRDLIRRALEIANQLGDLSFAAFSRVNLNTNLLAAGDPLEEVQREAENGRAFAQKIRFGLVIDHITVQLAFIRTLRGATSKFGSLDCGSFDELGFERHLANNPALRQPECLYYIRKLQARFLAGDYASALDASERAKRLLWTAPSNLEIAEYHLHGGLCRAALWDSTLSLEERQVHLEALVTHQRELRTWAENCADNFENRAALLEAEIARIEGRELDAERLYERAIRSAHANGFVHNEAVAYEIAACFYAGRGFEKFSRTYLREARYCYVRWGADGKVRQLERLYPYLGEEYKSSLTGTFGTSIESLDLATVIKLSQAMSSETVLESLIDTLMRTAIEHAGAERGLLVLAQGVKYQTVAEATINADRVSVGPPQTDSAAADLPESVIHYVLRTKESVLLHDASADPSFAGDEYVRRHDARSILCLPLLKESRLIGVLYLENNLTPHVFTPGRMVVLKLLAAEAAISLENRRAEMEARESERRYREIEMALAHANRVATLGQMSASIAHEINQPVAAAVTNAQAGLRFLDAQPPNIEEVRQTLTRIIRLGNRVVEVVGRIRALAQKVPPRKDEFEVNEAIREVISLSHGELVKNNVAVHSWFTQGLPPVRADRVQLQQVLMNLMMNAIEAMSGFPDGPRELRISTGHGVGGDILVAVQDSGPGLDPENSNRVFDTFYSTKPGGLGIGLSICRSIIEAHEGRLWAETGKSGGAIFTFTLPAQRLLDQSAPF